MKFTVTNSSFVLTLLVSFAVCFALAQGCGKKKPRVPYFSVFNAKDGAAAFKAQEAFSDAFGKTEDAAEKGDLKSQLRLAELLEQHAQFANKGGFWLKIKAETWREKCAERGHIESQKLTGDYYKESGNTKEATKWYSKAAVQGDWDAQYILGKMYFEGDGVLIDYKEAVKWFRKAAEQGHPNAQNGLGHIYADNKWVLKDNKEAVKWFRKAAEQGHAIAQRNLGFAYTGGHGMNQDKVVGYAWHNHAAANGDSDSKEKLEEIIEEMSPEQIAKAQELSREMLKKNPKLLK